MIQEKMLKEKRWKSSGNEARYLIWEKFWWVSPIGFLIAVIFTGQMIYALQERNKTLEKLLSATVSEATVPMLINNKKGEIIYVNDKIDTLTGYAKDELVGEKIDIFIPSEFLNKHKAAYNNRINSVKLPNSVWTQQCSIKEKDGSELPVYLIVRMFGKPSQMYFLTIIDASPRGDAQISEVCKNLDAALAEIKNNWR